MAKNLVMFDPADNEWCAICRVGYSGDTPGLSRSTRLECGQTRPTEVHEKIDAPASIFRSSVFVREDEMDILRNLLLLDGIDFVPKYGRLNHGLVRCLNCVFPVIQEFK